MFLGNVRNLSLKARVGSVLVFVFLMALSMSIGFFIGRYNVIISHNKFMIMTEGEWDKVSKEQAQEYQGVVFDEDYYAQLEKNLELAK